MRIKGHGIDVVDLSRIGKIVSRDEDFVQGWFSDREILRLWERRFRVEDIGERIAAKEAVVKALGTGFSGDVSWQDIEVDTLSCGSTKIVLSGGALNAAQSLGVTNLVVSISHTASLAMASVIAVGE
jgi:holo-[acyl-carrier protein] synthase